MSLAQSAGGTIALAIANSVFLNQATEDILAIVPNEPRSVVQTAVSGAGSTFFRTLDPSVRTAVLGAVTDAISRTYILAVTGAALTVVLSIFMSREKVSKFTILSSPFPHVLSLLPDGALSFPVDGKEARCLCPLSSQKWCR